MPHMHWDSRQNKLETPRDKDEVNKREIHECDGRAHGPDTMVAPLTPKVTHTSEVLTRTPPTIASCREEDAVMRKCPLTGYCCVRCILETKTKVGITVVKAPAPRINPNIDESPTTPKPHTHPSHECDGRECDPEATADPPTPKPTRKTEAFTRTPPTIASRREEDTEEVAIGTVLLRELHS